MLALRFNRLSFWAVITPLMVISTASDIAGLHLPFGIPIGIFCVFRLHDLGRTGKWVLLPMLLGFVVFIAVVGFVPPHQVPTLTFALSAATFLAIAWLGSEPGEPISNAWGGPQAGGLSFGRAA